ncbi:triacylglycerol lipase [Ostertagia ostertagi]
MMTILFIRALWLLLVTVIHPCVSLFSPTFNEFLVSTYGKEFADRMLRLDIGLHGSFGGGDGGLVRRARQQSVVLVHGLGGSAGALEVQRQHFLLAGWDESEVYGTTYGEGERTVLFADTMKCEYVKQIRSLIQAVAAFTRKRVDVIGYSMGSPISRKAILGGKCVDTEEHLGAPLTELVDTFVSVAGANYGSNLCFLPIARLCNQVNGLTCSSNYMKDINAKQRYEGLYIFAIYSPEDDINGYQSTCGDITSSVAGSDEEFQRPGNHALVMVSTVDLQANLISSHREDRR